MEASEQVSQDLYALDWDLHCALDENPEARPASPVVHVLATIPGENDGPNWHGILALEDGTFSYVEAGCDYSGWG